MLCWCITQRRTSIYINEYIDHHEVWWFMYCVWTCHWDDKHCKMTVNENFLVQFILNSSQSEYGPFQMSYNTMKDKWNVHELHSMLVKEEMSFKNQGSHSVHYVNHQGNQWAGKKFMKKHDKGKWSLKINDHSLQIQKKVSKDNNCQFCRKFGHFQKDFLKCKSWFEKKGEFNALVCFESNITEIPHNTWWIDFGCTTHVSNTMHGFLTIQNISPNEKFVFMGNRVKAPVEAVGTYCLKLKTGHH